MNIEPIDLGASVRVATYLHISTLPRPHIHSSHNFRIVAHTYSQITRPILAPTRDALRNTTL